MPFTLAPGKEPSPKSRPRHSAAYSQALALQNKVFTAAQDSKLSPRDLASLTKAFTDLEETKRKLRMKPLPKAIDTTKLRSGNKNALGRQGPMFTE